MQSQTNYTDKYYCSKNIYTTENAFTFDFKMGAEPVSKKCNHNKGYFWITIYTQSANRDYWYCEKCKLWVEDGNGQHEHITTSIELALTARAARRRIKKHKKYLPKGMIIKLNSEFFPRIKQTDRYKHVSIDSYYEV